MNRSITFTNSYCYDDILIKPRKSVVKSRKEISLKTRISKNISLNIPIVSSNMDTVTEDKMAIEMAKLGGVGVIHRYCSIESQVNMVKRVKRHVNFYISNPICIRKDKFIHDYLELVQIHGINTIIVVDENHHFCGIINKYNINTFYACSMKPDENLKTKQIQTIMSDKKHYSTIEKQTITKDFTKLIHFMSEYNINYLPVVDKQKVVGLVTLKDLLFYQNHNPNIDGKGNLIVGAAVGVNGDYLKRSKALIDAKCDFIVIDIAHGHSVLVPEAIKNIKKMSNIDIIAGNVATADGVEFLVKAGADGIKVNIGAGSICTTRIITGCGVPQFTAVLECSEAALKYDIPIIADGGHCGKIGNMVKALSAGASCCMLGRRLGGTKESPGKIIIKNNKKMKIIRGMAGYISNAQKNKKIGEEVKHNFTPEGVEGYVEYKGSVNDIVPQMLGGIKSGLSYCGVKNLQDLHITPIHYNIITSSGKHESNNHGIQLIQ